MKAIRIHELSGPDVMHLEEIAIPTLSAGEVLIKVAAVGINYADLMQRQGAYLRLSPIVRQWAKSSCSSSTIGRLAHASLPLGLIKVSRPTRLQ
ncbi:MAG TPA: hypothetical protein VFB60_14885 [Ktedonobacteraceae bacterium]|nr:hypothetical protein [Ktedonobacteraceae bacterium]